MNDVDDAAISRDRRRARGRHVNHTRRPPPRAPSISRPIERRSRRSFVRYFFLSFFLSIDDEYRSTTTTTRARPHARRRRPARRRHTARRARRSVLGVASISHRENALVSVTLTFSQPLDRGRRRCRHTTTDDARGDERFDDDDGQRCVECESVRHARRQGVGDEDGGACMMMMREENGRRSSRRGARAS